MQPLANHRAPRHGMTLVEMLVAMALSLIIILAVTQVFRVVGDNVLASRAVTELSGQLRTAGDQLRTDLSQLTVPVRPWTDLSSGQGYFEIYEGPFWDMGLGDGAAAAPTVPRDQPFFTNTAFGDFDDVLMFTVRSQGEPFIAQVPITFLPSGKVQSNVAEILWFTRWDDRNGDQQPDPGEVTLHRRALLVLPELNTTHTDGLPILTLGAGLTSGDFYNTFDISVGYRPGLDASGSSTWIRFANSLENLSLRENRTAHRIPEQEPVAQPNLNFPFLLSRALLRPRGTVLTSPESPPLWGVPTVNDDGNTATDDFREAGTFGSDDLTAIAPGVLGNAFGSDVILSNLLAFDVKVYDPTVPIVQADPTAGVSTDAMLPGDPGYLQRSGGPARTIIGQGGYVDLFYSRYTPGITSTFSNAPLNRSGMALNSSGMPRLPETIWGVSTIPTVYDTWSIFYEHDGVDQDGIMGMDIFRDPSLAPVIDQGTDGVDNRVFSTGAYLNGVDDVGERETSPPYPVPLRGVQVRIRLIDPDTRQVRQVTVASDFIPE